MVVTRASKPHWAITCTVISMDRPRCRQCSMQQCTCRRQQGREASALCGIKATILIPILIMIT
jgi:hypothetical protein